MDQSLIIKLLGLPPDYSAHGAQIDYMIWLVHLLMAVLFIGWGIFFFCALIKFRRSRNPQASYHGVKSHVSSYLEVAVAVAEVILLVGFSIPFWSKVVNTLPDEKSAVVVHVIAEQFAWNVHYPGPDGIFGKTNPKLINQQTNPVGLENTDPNAADDFVTVNQMHLPVNKPALIYLTSKDVIHCFSVPVMRVKQDVIPGMRMPVWFTPIKTGKFDIACAQLCGIGHYRMKGYLTVDSKEDFDKWLSQQTPAIGSGGGADDFWN